MVVHRWLAGDEDLDSRPEAHAEVELIVNDTSHDLAWVELARVAALNPEESMLPDGPEGGRPVTRGKAQGQRRPSHTADVLPSLA